MLLVWPHTPHEAASYAHNARACYGVWDVATNEHSRACYFLLVVCRFGLKHCDLLVVSSADGGVVLDMLALDVLTIIVGASGIDTRILTGRGHYRDG